MNPALPWGWRLLTGLLQLVGSFLLRRLVGTCRVSVFNREIGFRLLSRIAEQPIVGAVWHQTMIPAVAYFGPLPLYIMVSRSKDGEIAARIAQGFGLGSVRGSSSSGGREALRTLIDHLRSGRSAVFICDGPRGPARIAKIGAVVAARETGAPILPVALAMSRPWLLKSWDRTAIPKPGSRIGIMFSEPFLVPRDATNDDCERIRVALQERLCAMEAALRGAICP